MPSKSQTPAVFVRGLSFETTDEQLSTHFSAIAPVRRAFLVKDAKTKASRGFGFVQFAFEEDAKLAAEKLNGTDLQGRKLLVQVASRDRHGESAGAGAGVAGGAAPADEGAAAASKPERQRPLPGGASGAGAVEHRPARNAAPSAGAYTGAGGSRPHTAHASERSAPLHEQQKELVLLGLPRDFDANRLWKRVKKLKGAPSSIKQMQFPRVLAGNQQTCVAFVRFDTKAHRDAAVKKLEGHSILGHEMAARPREALLGKTEAFTKARVIVRNLRFDASAQHLLDALQRHTANAEAAPTPAAATATPGTAVASDKKKKKEKAEKKEKAAAAATEDSDAEEAEEGGAAAGGAGAASAAATERRANTCPITLTHIHVPLKDGASAATAAAETEAEDEESEGEGSEEEKEEKEEDGSDSDSDAMEEEEEEGAKEGKKKGKKKGPSHPPKRPVGPPNRGFAFLEFATEGDALAAVQALNGKKVYKRVVAVDRALSKEDQEAAAAAAAEVAEAEAAKAAEEGEKKKAEEKAARKAEKKKAKEEAEAAVEKEEEEEEAEAAAEEEDEEASGSEDEESDAEDKEEEDEDDEDDEDEDIEMSDLEEEEEGEEEEDGSAAAAAAPAASALTPAPASGTAPVEAGTTLFLRNIPFDATDANVYSSFKVFGPLRYARVVVDRLTQRSKGTAFVQFYRKESADRALRAAGASDAHSSDIAPASKDIAGAAAAEAAAAAAAEQSAAVQKAAGSSSEEKKKAGRTAAATAARAALLSALAAGGIKVMDRTVIVARAVNKEEAERLDELGIGARAASGKRFDKRHTYLLYEGNIRADSDAGKAMPAGDMAKRETAMREKKDKMKSPLFFVSPTRLSIRNLGKGVGDSDLKQLLKQASVKGILSGLVEEGEGDPELRPPETARARVQVVKCKVMREQVLDGSSVRAGDKDLRGKMDSGAAGGSAGGVTAIGKSKGYAFVEMATHVQALAALRELNNNPAYTQYAAGAGGRGSGGDREKREDKDKPRLIVEFAIEDWREVKKQEKKQQLREQLKEMNKGGEAPKDREGHRDRDRTEGGRGRDREMDGGRDRDGARGGAPGRSRSAYGRDRDAPAEAEGGDADAEGRLSGSKRQRHHENWNKSTKKSKQAADGEAAAAAGGAGGRGGEARERSSSTHKKQRQERPSAAEAGGAGAGSGLAVASRRAPSHSGRDRSAGPAAGGAGRDRERAASSGASARFASDDKEISRALAGAGGGAGGRRGEEEGSSSRVRGRQISSRKGQAEERRHDDLVQQYKQSLFGGK